ncbi:MAG: Ig-like domain-containing protein [Oceanobacter sp.]
MFKPGLITAAVLTMLLSACGGGESTVTGDSTGTDTGGTDTGGTDTGGTDTGGTTTNVSEGLGAGTGSEHEPGELTLSASTILTGGSVTVTVNGVDKNDNNSDLTNSSYQYTFSSVCASASPATASLSTASTFSSSGAASTVYSNSGCSGTDTITAQLFNQTDDVSVATPLATATATLQATAPQLGFGSGVDYRDGKIDGELYLVGVTETVLTANAVDRLNLNALVNSDAYAATWTSSCDTANFSIPSQTLNNSTIQTRYDADTTKCPGDNTITLTLALKSDTSNVLDTISAIVKVGISSAAPDLGLGNGDDFLENTLGLSDSNVLMGEPVTVTVNLVDSDDLNALLNERYQFNFISSCDTSAAFSRTNVISSTGTATTTYTPSAVACASGDITVTAQLVDLDTGNDVTGVTATATVNATLPTLGTGTGAEFSDAAADLAVTVTGSNATTLTADAVNPLNANAAVSSDRYEVRWTETTACASGAGNFSVASQSLNSAIETRYTAGAAAPTCASSEVTARLYLTGGTEVLDSIVMAVTLEETTTTTATPDLGLGNGDDFLENVLGLSDSNVLVGEPVTVTVNLVDSDDLNALLSERYQFNITSDCDTSAAFSRANVISSTGTATTTYTPSAVACASGDITVTAQLVDLDTGNDVTGVTATATLNATLPTLGTGTGAEFSDAAADLAVVIRGGNETTLTADVVNPLNANTAISSDLYEVRWTETTACASGAGSFSVPNQLLDSSIATRYSSGAAAPACTRSEVTAALYLAGGTELLDSIVIDVTLEEEGTSTDQITIGSGTGDSFLQGNLAFSDSVALIGDALTVSVNLVDSTDSQYVLLPERYRFDFESDCDSSTEFARSETISSTGTASTQYTPSIACIDVDTDSDDVVDRGSIGLTVKLVDADTGVVVTDENSAPIQASGTISVTAPKLGLGIEAEFRDDPSDLAVSISSNVDETYLVLNAVNPLDANSEVTSPVYWVEWEETSSCTTALATFKGTFSVQRQPLSSEIRTRYEIGNGFEDCGTEVEVKASLYLADGSQSLINAIAVLDTVSIKVTKDSGTSPSTAIPDLGLGNGDDFLENVLGLSDSNVLVGEPVTVTVNLVDSDDLNALLSERYQFNFTSNCDTSAAFSRANVISSTGTATTTYTPSAVACASGDITVTAQLVDLDTGNDVTGVTATATLNATLPTLGTGTGAEFSDAAADLAVTITGSNATTLTADAVNPLNANAAISSDRYEVRWTETTACASGAGNFSVASQPLNSAIETRYTTGAAAPTCTSSEVTASLYLTGGTEVLDSIVIAVSLTEAGQDEVAPALGANSGSDFIDGALLLSDFDVLVGGSLTVEVSGVNKVDGNNLLADTYQYVFSSTCADASPATAEFSISQTFSANAAVSSTYRNLGCTSGDTITVKLFEADANPDTATPLATASAQIDTARPLLGSGFGSSFIEDSVSGETELDGEEETTLTLNLVDPLNANALISSDDYVLEWGADIPDTCSTGDFSISKQSFDTGAVSTRYSTELSTDSGNDCTGTHTINAIVYERTSTAVCTFADTSGCLDSTVITLTITQGVDARLGTGEEGTFSEGDITIFPDSIGAGSSALISVNIVDANGTPQYQQVNNRSYGVKVTSGCATQVPSQASFTYTETIVAQGLATFSYTAEGCTGTDDIEVELFKVVDGLIDVAASLGTATGTITIADIELGAISYDEATADAISISTIGDAVLPKQAVLTFTVTDENGDNLENETVEFELTNTTGGVALAQPSDVTNADGQVTAIINSGTSHTVVAVIAKVQVEGADTVDKADDIYIQTSSQPITVTTGIADQDSFSVSVDVQNPGAYDKNGVSLTVSAYAADQYQNPVADGTAINFTAESGIIGSSCLTADGTCSVTWTSSGVRPGNHDPSLSRVNEIELSCRAFSSDSTDPTYPSSSGSQPFEQYCFERFEEGYKTVLGMTTIMAYTSGEAGFTDQNGNGKFDFFDIDGDDSFTLGVDETEPFVALPEAFRDDDNDGDLSEDATTGRPVEFFADFDSDGSYDDKPDYYQGVVCSDALLEQEHETGEGHCHQLTHISSDVRIIQSTATAPDMTLYTFNSSTEKYEEQDSISLGTSGVFYVLLQDENGHMPASGTTFTASGDGYKVSGDSGAVSDTLGSLYNGTDHGLPGFGQLFEVFYEVDDTPVSVTLSGTFDGFSSTLKLVKAP